MSVSFDDIADSALEYALSIPLADGVGVSTAETALRTAAVKILRERGIALANPQRQVRLRDLDMLRTMLARAAEERAQRDAPDASADGSVPRKPNGD